MRLTKRIVSIILTVALLMSCVVMTTITTSAAKGDKVYCKASFPVFCYMWIKNTETNNAAWPGVAMESLGDGVYCYEVSGDFDMIIFNNGSGNQTSDAPYPGNNMIYDFAKGTWDVYDLSGAEPIVSCSKNTGSSFVSDTLDVTLTVRNADSAYYTIDGGAQQSITSETVTVTMGNGVAVGSATTLRVVAQNANGTVDQSYTYTKKDAGSITDGSTADALGGYYATNPNGQVGKKTSITVDGDPSEWDSSMIIAQGVANDDPRVYRNSSMHEIPVDDYALYAAWDDSNLYLMWEMANVQDDVAPNDDFPLTQGNLWIYNLPVFFYFSTDPTIEGDGTVATGGTVWDSGITLDAHIDTVVAISTNGSNGPFVYKSNDSGKIEYNDTKHSSIQLKWGNGMLSKNLWGIDKAYGKYNNRKPGDTLDESSAWKDFYAGSKHKKSLDMCYEMAIPLDLLGVSASEIASTGIGLMKVSTFGTSGMNCLPADPSMWDNATGEYSKDPSSSAEKEDADHITVPLARIGALLPGGTPVVKPTTPTPTQAPQTVPATQPATQAPTTPVNPGALLIGDADNDGQVTITDATYVQRYLAKLATANINLKAADADEDDDIAIVDATYIQRWLAKLPTSTCVGQYV